MSLHGREGLEGRYADLVPVPDEQLEACVNGWVESARAHAGELMVVYADPSGESRYKRLYMGIIRSDLGQETDVSMLNGVDLTDGVVVTSDGHGVEDISAPIRVGFLEAFDSFQTFKPHFLDRDGLPRFQVAFGNEAVVQWFMQRTDQLGGLSGVELYRYTQLARRLGIEEPITTPEIEASTREREDRLIAQLRKKTAEQAGLTEQIDRVYSSVGSDIRLYEGGLTAGVAPETTGEAALRTHNQRHAQERNQSTILHLQQELADLGIQSIIL
jgi:hypothetical protein